MSLLRNIKGNWAKLTFAKTCGIVNRDRRRIQPIADRRVPSSGPRNHCGTLFGFSPFFVSSFLEWRIVNSYRQLHLSATQDRHDVFCRQNFEVWQPLKQTVVSKVKLFTCFWSARSAHLLFFSIFSNISRSETAHLFLWIILCLTSCDEYCVENKSSRQTAAYFAREYSSKATPNFNSLAAKHAMFSTN